MAELLQDDFLSWFQFAIILFGCGVLYFIVNKIHLFRKDAKEKSIGFRMFSYLLFVIIVVSFTLIHPLYHLFLLLIVFGAFYKNIISYSKALLSLYFSNVKLGDKISLGNDTGTLIAVNYGGLHLLTPENKIYFPFNAWKGDKIIRESEKGTVLISFMCKDVHDRSDYQSLNHLKKNLFNYPFLAVTKVSIDKERDEFKVAARIDHEKFKVGLMKHIEKAGFELNKNN
ncbi:MAG: hypothetical protein P1U56_04295 [Saprospiraceae bacterium]|nr:hypothetical protein [Saprospiraceae bacterium]